MFSLKLSDRRYITILLSTAVVFLFADQNLLAPNLSLIANEFHFNDQEKDEKLGANIALGFFIVGGPIALLAGYYADLVNRCILFGAILLLGAFASGSTFFVTTYTQLLALRVLTGISIGGATPIIFSILADYYPGSKRIRVSTLLGISMSGGIAFGQLIAGLIGPKLGWRVPFLIIAFPTFICSILMLTSAKEPVRGSQEEEVVLYRSQMVNNTTLNCIHNNQNIEQDSSSRDLHHESADQISVERSKVVNSIEIYHLRNNSTKPKNEEIYSEKIDISKVKTLFSTPTVLIIYLQGIPGCIPWGMIYVYLNDYLSANRGMSVQTATIAVTLFGIGGLFGQLLGGWTGQIIYNKEKKYLSYLMGASTLIGILPMIYVINAKAGTVDFYIAIILSGFLVSVTGPNVRSILQNVCAPETRGTAFAFFNLTDDIGKGGGPWIVAALVSACNGSRNIAYNICILFWLFCGILLLLTSLTLEKDEDVVQIQIRNAITGNRQSESESTQPQPDCRGHSTSTLSAIWTEHQHNIGYNAMNRSEVSIETLNKSLVKDNSLKQNECTNLPYDDVINEFKIDELEPSH